MNWRLPTRFRPGLACVAAALCVSACALLTAPSGFDRLRVTNGGSTHITSLTLLFPQDRIEFGNVPPGATTAYQQVRNGVFAYAAYRFERDGALINQPVIDWVGEKPLEGRAFTYTIELDPGPPRAVIRQIRVTRDE